MEDTLLQILVGDNEKQKLDEIGAKLGLRTRSATARFLINRDHAAMFPAPVVSVSAETVSPAAEEAVS